MGRSKRLGPTLTAREKRALEKAAGVRIFTIGRVCHVAIRR